MDKRIKRLIMMTVMLAVMLTGCSKVEVDTDARMEKAEQLLNEKYGETFVVTEYLGDNVRYKTFAVEAYAAAYPDLRFEAIVDMEGDGMRDFYVAKRVSAKATEAVENAISGLESAHFVHVESLDLETTLEDPDASIEAFLEANKKKELMVYLYMDKNEAGADQVNDCMDRIAGCLDCASGNVVVFLTDQDMMEEIKDYVGTQRSFYGSYQEMPEEDYMGAFRFEKGTMSAYME